MRRVLVNTTVPDADLVRQAADVLRSGGVVAYPTDTLYGLAVDPRNERAVSALYRIKGRLVDRAIPLIAAGREQLELVGAAMAETAATLAGAFWPGPVSLVLPAWPGLAAAVLAGGETVAVRVPDLALARALAAAFGYPVTSTSANPSGEPATADPDAVERWLGADVDLLLDGGRAPGGPASTIVDTTGDRPRLVREGAVPWARLRAFLEVRPGSRT